jgi:superfamily II DNA or RNA helicase
MVRLRDYQTGALARFKDAYKSGKRQVLVSLPTGTGKTVVFTAFSECAPDEEAAAGSRAS